MKKLLAILLCLVMVLSMVACGEKPGSSDGEKTITIGALSKQEREQLVKGENFQRFFDKEVFRREFPYFEEHQNLCCLKLCHKPYIRSVQKPA